MSKGVMKTKPAAKKAETKPDPYANYTAGELVDMIANTTEELQTAIKRLDNLNEETAAYQVYLDSAYSRYQEELELHKQHQEEVAKAEKRVEFLSDNLKVIAEGFTAKISKK